MTTLHFPPFRLDNENQCLWRGQDDGRLERIMLRPKAFAVLRYLLERPGQLIAEGELLDAVWSGVVVQPEVLKSQIYDIRRILEDSPKAPRYIETVPRRGYRFLARVSLANATVPAAAPANPGPCLVGRASALEELCDRLRAASSGLRQVVLITGEPGIGKTALVDALQRQAASEMPGLQIARGQCIEGYGGHEPYYPVLEALDQLCRVPGASSLVAILAAEAPTWLVQFPALMARQKRDVLRRETLGATSERMLREIGAALESITATRPLLLVLEDLHWVDPSTVDLLSAVARRRAPAKLLLVATMRPVHSVPLAQLKRDLIPRQLVHEIDLPPLSLADVAEHLAAGDPSSAVPVGLAELIYRHSEGNPLFMIAALDNLRRRGLLTRAERQWRLCVPLQEIAVGVPEDLRAMIEAMIDRLSAEEQRAVEVASVSGMAFSAKVAAAGLGRDPEAVEELFDALARRALLVRRTGDLSFPDGSVDQRFEFVHALYREVIYGRQPLLRRANLHRRIGEFIEVRFAQGPDHVASELAHAHELSYHFRACGDWPRVVRYLQLAAERALQRYAHAHAAGLLREALDVMGNFSRSQGATSELAIMEKLAMIYAACYDERATETYLLIAERAESVHETEMQVRALLGASFPLSCVSGARCMALLDRALDLTAGISEPLVQAHMRASAHHDRIWTRGWNSADVEAFRAAFAEIMRSGRQSLIAYHMVEKSELEWASARYRDALVSTREGYRVLSAEPESAFGLNLSMVHWGFRLQTVWTLLFAGKWGDALREAEEGISILERNADNYCAQTLRLYQAWIHLFAFDHLGALRICESAFEAGESMDSKVTPLTPLAAERRILLIITGSAQIGCGQFDRARVNLQCAHEDLERHEIIFGWYWKMPLEWARTELAIAEERWDEAWEHSERFHAVAQATEERTWQALAWRAQARLALHDGNLEDARRLAAEALALVGSSELPLAAWQVHAMVADVAGAAGDAASARRHREVAQDLAQRLADSLLPAATVRQAFLSAPAIRTLLRSPP